MSKQTHQPGDPYDFNPSVLPPAPPNPRIEALEARLTEAERLLRHAQHLIVPDSLIRNRIVAFLASAPAAAESWTDSDGNTWRGKPGQP